MNKKSLLTVDVEASIATAYKPKLPDGEKQDVQEHLAHFLSVAKEPNTLIQPAKDALRLLQQQEKEKYWYERPVGIVVLAAIAGILSSLVAWKWGLNK